MDSVGVYDVLRMIFEIILIVCVFVLVIVFGVGLIIFFI